MAIATEIPHAYPEGKVATTVERQTAKRLASDTFLWAAGASIIASLILKLRRRDEEALFIRQWVPTLLLLGTYNKLVKLLGSE
jgi:hypothetical protein